MKLPSFFRLASAASLAGVFALTAVWAHPGHDESPTQPVAPAFLLSQAGPPPGGPRVPAGAVPAGSKNNSVSITTEDGFRVIRSNGWPDHEPGAFPRRGNPNTAAPQTYTFRVPLKPQAAAAPSMRGGWFFSENWQHCGVFGGRSS